MTPRQQLRARYPAILARATLTFGNGWAGLVSDGDVLRTRCIEHSGVDRENGK